MTLTGLAPGIYILRLFLSDGRELQEKLVIQ